MKMPDPDEAVLARRDAIVAALRAIVPGEGVIADESARRVYESDGLTAYRTLPMIVVLPETVEQISQVLRYCHAEGRSEEHTSELQSLMRISYAVFCLKKKNIQIIHTQVIKENIAH